MKSIIYRQKKRQQFLRNFYERLPFLSQVSVTVLVRLFAGFELTYCIAVAVAFPLFPDLDADLSEIFQAEE